MRLVDYVKANRGQLNLVQFRAIINQKDVDLDALDENGNSALYHLIKGGGTFQYAQLLLLKGITINEAVLELILGQSNQNQLLFLIASNHKAELPDHPQLENFNQLRNYQFPEQNPFGKIFKKIIDNSCNFFALSDDEIILLEGFKQQNALQTLEGEETGSSSESESLPLPKILPFDHEITNPKIVALIKEFLGNFSNVINQLDKSRQFILDQKNQQPIVKALRNCLEKQPTIADLATIASDQQKACEELPVIIPAVERSYQKIIDYLGEIAPIVLEKLFTKNISKNNLPIIPRDIFAHILKFVAPEDIGNVAKLSAPSTRPQHAESAVLENKNQNSVCHKSS